MYGISRDGECAQFEPRSNSAEPVISVIFPVAALSHADRGETVDEFDLADVFRHLVAKLPLDPDAQRRAVLDRKRFAV